MISRFNDREFLSGLFLALIGGIGLVEARHYTFGSAIRMGPGYFPVVLSGLLLAIGAGIMIIAILNFEKTKIGAVNMRAVVMVTLSVVIFGVLLRPAGMIAAVSVTSVFAAFAQSGIRPLETAALALVLSTTMTLLFAFALGLSIPVWPQWI